MPSASYSVAFIYSGAKARVRESKSSWKTGFEAIAGKQYSFRFAPAMHAARRATLPPVIGHCLGGKPNERGGPAGRPFGVSTAQREDQPSCFSRCTRASF